MIVKQVIKVASLGLPLLSILFSCDQNEFYKEYYDNGNLKVEVEMNDNLKNGRHIEFFENGDTAHLSYWKQGKANGLRIDYYSNGQKESVNYWKNNLQDGKEETYFESGKLKGVTSWKGGKEDGVGKFFYENGQINEVYQKKDGMLHGPYKWYYENGNLEEEGYYFNGIKRGVIKHYYKGGNLFSEKHFISFKGKQTYTGGIEYNEDGSIKEETIRVDTEALNDTIDLNEELSLKIILKKPFFSLSKVIIGSYDENFNLIDSTKTEIIPMTNGVAFYNLKPQGKGIQFVRGYVSNYKLLDKKKNITKESHTYFEHQFFVK